MKIHYPRKRDRIHTNEAAASFLDETYRVATTLTPSVTQKFIKLGYEMIAWFESKAMQVSAHTPQSHQLLPQID